MRHPVRLPLLKIRPLLEIVVSDVACRCAERGAALMAGAHAIKSAPLRAMPIALDVARVMGATVAADGRDAVAAFKARVAALTGAR